MSCAGPVIPRAGRMFVKANTVDSTSAQYCRLPPKPFAVIGPALAPKWVKANCTHVVHMDEVQSETHIMWARAAQT